MDREKKLGIEYSTRSCKKKIGIEKKIGTGKKKVLSLARVSKGARHRPFSQGKNSKQKE